jgi:hypothetical protein
MEQDDGDHCNRAEAVYFSAIYHKKEFQVVRSGRAHLAQYCNPG